MSEEDLGALIAKLLAERLVELGLPEDLAARLAKHTAGEQRLSVLELEDGAAIGISRRCARRARSRVPQGFPRRGR